ncbi:ATP-binding protein [Thalassoporum mexicanum]|uniref:ATP-binding protein n=1 Tax=Thalassoporum mexicanum TaxID=3457544 RepID=UPI000684CECD|nr:anti-sigma regulatory factor [Pseudanabaena sp. PCC 7367]
MIATSLRPVSGQKWSTLSFASTLYLKPILDLLLSEVPSIWHAELRLGLQEALVNAVRHGNKLDPGKQVTIHFSISSQYYWWMIADQGEEGCPELSAHGYTEHTPSFDSECGRGFFILHQIFDRVVWEEGSHQLKLGKHLHQNCLPAIC